MVDSPIPLPLDAQGRIALPGVQQIVSLLPPDVLANVQSGVAAATQAAAAVQGAAPAIALISTIANGGSPSEDQTLGALAATTALINPAAGALVATVFGVEKLAQDVLSQVGLISESKTYGFFGLIQQGDPVPYGPGDRAWIPWAKIAAPAHGFLPVDGLYYLETTMAKSASGIGIGDTWWPFTLPMNATSIGQSRPELVVMWSLLMYGAKGNARPGPVAKNAFEAFLFPMLQTDLVRWANVQAAVPTRTVLMGAASLWNATHASGGDVTYSASDRSNPIGVILSQYGDETGVGREAPDLTIRLGPRIQPAPAPVPVSAATRAAASAAASSAAQRTIASYVASHAAAAAPANDTHTSSVVLLAGLALAAGLTAMLLHERKGR